MIFLSIAYDKAENIRLYLNKADDPVCYCTTSLNSFQIPIYLEIILQTIGAFGDPLKATNWTPAKEDCAPKTARKVVGISAGHNRITLGTMTKQNEVAEQKTIEEGIRAHISSAYYLLADRLFNTGLESTLAEQAKWRPSVIKMEKVR